MQVLRNSNTKHGTNVFLLILPLASSSAFIWGPTKIPNFKYQICQIHKRNGKYYKLHVAQYISTPLIMSKIS